MGCGQSKIHLYPRKSKSKANGKKGGHGDSEAETDEEEGHIEDAENRERDRAEESEENSNKESGESDEEVSVSLLRARNLSLLQSQEISSSQQNFFRMLDKKIEEGPDYDSNSETEIALEEARLNALVQHWESASLTASMCSSASRSLQTTPVRQTPAKQLTTATRGLLPTGLPPKVLNSEFLPHPGTPPTSSQLTASGTLKLTPSKQITIPQMNSGMLHQISVMPQIPLSINTETSSPNMATVTANSSNALAIMQATPNAQTTPQYVLAIPTGPSPLLGKTGQVSPKRLVDGRLLINTTSPLCNTQQMQPTPPNNPLQQQYITATPPNLQQQTAPLNYAPNAEYRFPPAISVQRLAPQVQRQLRETQELIKDSCPQLYAAGYGSPGPPPLRNQAAVTARNHPTNRRPTLETQFSQELS
ncbi:hypothetical protein DOY81_002103 [Sarcophaga bullata]|nr:hypothetical protein DOY81_002103 [Sarcophaga bullata]